MLFIGREPRYVAGSSYVENMLEGFEVGGCGKSTWWRHLLFIAYGIEYKGTIKYEDLPESADDVAKEMLEGESFNFAVMNVSKYSNDRADGATMNAPLINRFLEDSELDKRNFFQEELELLSPDIIITANLWEADIDDKYLDLCLPPKNFSDNLSPEYKGVVNHYKYKVGSRKVDLLDIFHLSAPNKRDKEGFYAPVMEVLFLKK